MQCEIWPDLDAPDDPKYRCPNTNSCHTTKDYLNFSGWKKLPFMTKNIQGPGGYGCEGTRIASQPHGSWEPNFGIWSSFIYQLRHFQIAPVLNNKTSTKLFQPLNWLILIEFKETPSQFHWPQVHCSAGVGRTGTFIALYKLWQDYQVNIIFAIFIIFIVIYIVVFTSFGKTTR